MADWKEYIRKVRKEILLLALFLLVFMAVFYLYDVPREPAFYGMLICFLLGGTVFATGYSSYIKKKKTLLCIKENFPVGLGQLSEPQDGNEALYRELLLLANEERMKAENSRKKFYTELTDYYTLWVHQIKTPISALRLLLQEDGEKNKGELAELFKVEQYVEMVLGYLRTEDISADMKLGRYSLDEIVREQIHKYARIFIGKKLALNYEGVEEEVLTDSKWLGFVIGQILSNALKYTKNGGISIYMSRSRPKTLVIEDTGMGIRKEDLPRVFEKGFTGCNGREGNSATGIGLYLCAKITKKLGHEITIDATPGEGTRVYLSLGRETLEMD